MTGLDNYSKELEGFRASDKARESLVSELIAKFQTLSEDYNNLKDDYASERDIRRNYQKTVDDQKQKVRDYERQFETSSFILALIDGDGAIFQNSLLQAASGDGGSEAASRLNHAIRNHVAPFHSNSGNWPIMVHVYLSLEKLASKLASVGLLRSPSELRVFAQRFSVNQPLFSIIDVGQGKERADHKIREMLRTFSDNPTCRHIIFGGCHDAGYLTHLDQFKHNELTAARITLLETTPAFKGFYELSYFKRARFDDVFKSEPLPDSAPSVFASAGNGSAPHASIPTPAHSLALFRANTNASPRPSVSNLSTRAESSPTSSVNGVELNGDASWATIGKSGATPSGNISIAPIAKTNKKKKYVYYNKDDQRLDEPLPSRDPAATASLEDRMRRTGKKMCNNWHLGGHCDNGKLCHFQHEPKMTPAELIALRYKARSLACKNRYCENFDCYLGHQCALEREFGKCSFPDSCHLRSTHGMDRRRYVRFDEDGNAKYA